MPFKKLLVYVIYIRICLFETFMEQIIYIEQNSPHKHPPHTDRHQYHFGFLFKVCCKLYRQILWIHKLQTFSYVCRHSVGPPPKAHRKPRDTGGKITMNLNSVPWRKLTATRVDEFFFFSRCTENSDV